MSRVVRKELSEAREVCPTSSQRLLMKGALLVDVREPSEVARIGYAGCEVTNIPLSQFEDRWREVPRDRDVILACAAGERSLKATYFLMYQGYDRVMNMKPGIARWAARGFPVVGSVDAAGSATAASACCGGTEPAPSAAACCGDASAASGSGGDEPAAACC